MFMGKLRPGVPAVDRYAQKMLRMLASQRKGALHRGEGERVKELDVLMENLRKRYLPPGMKYDSPLGDARERAWFRRTLGENAKLAGTRCGPSEKEKPMARIRDIYDIIDAVAPFSTALDFDNSGLLVGDGNTQVTRVLLALDITPVVVAEAAAMNANLILSHHPVIFHPLKSLGPQDVP